MVLDLYQGIRCRASTRRFSPGEVPDGAVSRILEAACRAPSAGNLQPWRFRVVRSLEKKRMLAGAALNQSFIEQAPLVIAVCADLDLCQRAYGLRGRDLYSIQDTAAATQNILLAAVAEGLGACWVGAFDEARVGAALELDRGLRPLALIPLGRPVEPGEPGPRRPHEELTSFS